MKTMTCNQLGGACDEKFQAESFDEIAELSKAMEWKCIKNKMKRILKLWEK
ncbi:hypothetical protein [Moritella viscosa]|uniref:hypothetical protein n=1 Tax=Moritella viscosa TaxID=80854 RepID=UPI00091BCC33|nr:hypothetical protein [Moritella viscosa]SGZ03445.1 Putative uncharacterized protein [Moritella viscosa]